MGIHNEPGHSRVSPVPPLRDLVSQLVDLITRTDDTERSFLPFKHDGNDKIVLMVNNLGGVSELELGGIVGAVVGVLEERKVKVIRVLAGTFMVCVLRACVPCADSLDLQFAFTSTD
jgi:dihydroxyacetone kinase